MYANLPKVEKRDGTPFTPADSRWIHARHVDYLDQILVDLYAGVYRELGYVGVIVEEPPRHGKSELCSHYNPAWYLGTRPDDRIILASYEATFAATWGKKARDTLTEYGKEAFGIEVNHKASAMDAWDIKGHKGGMFTAGAGGGITGKGANVLIADDLVKNAQEANSELMRERLWEWWKTTFRTRLEPDGVIFVIGTRWHEDDIIGRLLAVQGDSREGETHHLYDPDGDRFLRVRLPAIAEEPDDEFPDADPLGRKPGDALFPERWPYDKLKPLMRSATWAALYQQRPVPKEGGLFSSGNFAQVPHPGGKFKKVVRRWDLAATEAKAGQDPDYTVGLLLGLHEDGNYYILDVVRDRTSPEGVERLLRKTLQHDRMVFGSNIKFTVEREPGSQGKLYARHLAQRVFRGANFRAIPSTGSKMLRADTVAAATERGEVCIVKAAWNREFLHEVQHFPFGKHDDMVDALSGAYQDLTSRGGKLVTW